MRTHTRSLPGDGWLSLVVAGIAAGLFFAFREPPGLGDDLDYWGLAFDLVRGSPGAWSENSFHHFRWPVWLPIWLGLQVGVSGIAAYYVEPLFYFCGSAVVVFLLARQCALGRPAAVLAAFLYAMHPFLDTTFSRPMPDLSEGFFGALALLAWMKSDAPVRRAGWLIATGLCLWLAFANRVTGVFVAVGFAAAVVVSQPRRWRELLVVAGAVFVFVVIEWIVWAAITGNPLAVLHANLGGADREGAQPTAAGELFTRFLEYFARGNLEIFLTILLLIGLASAVVRPAVRMPAVFLVTWFVCYTAAVQDLDPLQPLVRTTGRFLGVLTPLLGLMAAAGVEGVLRSIGEIRGVPRAPYSRVAVQGCVAVAILAMCLGWTERTVRAPGCFDAVARVVDETPPGSKVLADPGLFRIAHLCASRAASRLEWTVEKQLVVRTDELEQQLADTDEVWFFQRNIWNWIRMDAHAGKIEELPRLASILTPPFAGVRARDVVDFDGRPEFVFLRVGASSAPDSTPLPAIDSGGSDSRAYAIPREWQGRVLAIVATATGGHGIEWKVKFDGNEPLRLRPIAAPSGCKNTIFLKAPADAHMLTIEKAARIEELRVFPLG